MPSMAQMRNLAYFTYLSGVTIGGPCVGRLSFFQTVKRDYDRTRFWRLTFDRDVLAAAGQILSASFMKPSWFVTSISTTA